MAALGDLFDLLPPVHAALGSDGTLLVLCSDAADPGLEDRQALVVALRPGAQAARVVAQLDGAQRFVLARAGDEASCLVASAGGALTSVEAGVPRPSGEVVGEGMDTPMFLGRLCCQLATAQGWYLGGMSRQLYVLDAARGRWERADAGLLDRSDSVTSAIYGMAPAADGLLLVGGDGEIWRGTAGRWRTQESGTNLMLNAVARLLPDQHLACGAGRTVLAIGDDGAVAQVEHEIDPDFLFELRCFGSFAFVFAEDGLHRFAVAPQPRYQALVEGSRGARLAVQGEGALHAIGKSAIGSTGDGLSWRWTATADIVLDLPD